MCGIVGYLGANSKTACEVLLSGLRRLEYRGYDSAGLATLENDGQLYRWRSVGRVGQLARQLEASAVDGRLGIAHTRWATHGRPTENNAHPHLDSTRRIALVHNGIIENHASIRTFLEQQGVVFQSETDTESLVQLIGFFYQQTGDLTESVRSALREVHGTFGIAVICSEAPQTLIAARRGSPLLIGIGAHEFIVASDASAIVAHTTQAMHLNDDEIVCLGPHGLHATTIDAKAIEARVDSLEMTLEEIELVGYEHHMLKEIHEQPDSLRNTLRGRLQHASGAITLGGLTACQRQLPMYRRVLLFGCGTAWHSALIGKYLFEELAGIPADVEYASELRYRNPIIEPGTLAIAISQSGETADTLAALREVRTKGAFALGVVNVVGSTIARETDAGVYLHVGPEIGVASTKAFTSQVAVLAMMATDLGRRRHLSQSDTRRVIRELQQIPEKIHKALELDAQIRELATGLSGWDNWVYLGRGINFPVALEGALKLKEISYIHAEGLPAAEMKHGPIAMIDPGMPVVVIAPQDHTYEKVLSNIEEVRSRDGRVIVVATHGDHRMAELVDDVLYVPPTLPILAPLVTTIPLQLLAYHIAVARGRDVDKPRNLAKSVTVE